MREATNKIIEMIDEQILDPRSVVVMCLKYMSEDDVADMARVNELFDIDEEEADYESSELRQYTDAVIKSITDLSVLDEDVEDDTEEDYYDELYHDASEEELRKMGCFDNLNDAEEDYYETSTYDYVVFVGDDKENLHPSSAWADFDFAVKMAKETMIEGEFRYAEVVYMPEEKLSKEKIVWQSY